MVIGVIWTVESRDHLGHLAITGATIIFAVILYLFSGPKA